MQIENDRIAVIGYTGKLLGWMTWPNARNYSKLEYATDPGPAQVGEYPCDPVRRRVSVGWARVGDEIDRAVLMRRGQPVKSLPRLDRAD